METESWGGQIDGRQTREWKQVGKTYMVSSRVSGDTCNLVTKKVEDGSPSCCDNGGECDYFWWLDLGEKHLFS